MNDKFFSLPEEKQQRIINAGYHVFSKNSYKKSPVGEIALTAGISKSLLFHYFHNKKELYLFLWNKAAEVTLETVKSYACYETEDLFEMMRRHFYAETQSGRFPSRPGPGNDHQNHVLDYGRLFMEGAAAGFL